MRENYISGLRGKVLNESSSEMKEHPDWWKPFPSSEKETNE